MTLDKRGLPAPVRALTGLGAAAGGGHAAFQQETESRIGWTSEFIARERAGGANTMKMRPVPADDAAMIVPSICGPLEQARVGDLRGRDAAAHVAVGGWPRVTRRPRTRRRDTDREQVGGVGERRTADDQQDRPLLEDGDLLVASDDGPAFRRGDGSSPPTSMRRPRRSPRDPRIRGSEGLGGAVVGTGLGDARPVDNAGSSGSGIAALTRSAPTMTPRRRPRTTRGSSARRGSDAGRRAQVRLPRSPGRAAAAWPGARPSGGARSVRGRGRREPAGGGVGCGAARAGRPAAAAAAAGPEGRVFGHPSPWRRAARGRWVQSRRARDRPGCPGARADC